MSRSTWACELKYYTFVYTYFRYMSRSTWACELKFYTVLWPAIALLVTLHVSVWVEMTRLRLLLTMAMSRSTWACELKLFIVYIPELSVRHAPRERVSWNIPKNSCTIGEIGHAPRERVSWNAFIFLSCDCCILVTLHVSVWVEIFVIGKGFLLFGSRSTWACELKFVLCCVHLLIALSRSTWACELK